jgi:hypothetical protein
MAEQPPFKSQYAQLSPLDELAFRQWVAQNQIPFNPDANGSDYDMRGYWRGMQQGNPQAMPTQINPNDNQPHYTDYYKTPLHQSFSAGSQFAGPDAGQWINDHQLADPSGRILFDEQQPMNPLAKALFGQ